MARLDKAALKAALLEQLQVDLAAAREAHRAAMEGATHDEARPENDKDTRGLEQSYLARGQAQRVADLDTAVAVIAAWAPRAFEPTEAVGIGALVRVEEDGRERVFLLAPQGGGIALPGGVTVLTPTSPVGRVLMGRAVDEECDIGKRTLIISAIE